MNQYNRLLLNAIGLDVSPNGYIIDQDTFIQLYYKRKKIVYRNSNRYGFNEYLYDPINNANLCEQLLHYVADKDNINIISYGISKTPSGLLQASVQTDTMRLESYEYKSTASAYIDIILQLTGTDKSMTKVVEECA